MEWYRILIIIVGAVGLLAGIANWYFNGVDMPNGLVTLLSLIISATLGPDAFTKVKAGLAKTPPAATPVVLEVPVEEPIPVVEEVKADAGV